MSIAVVYIVVHDDRMYDMGDVSIMGVYATRETAEANIVTRTPSGARSHAWDAHNESCCGVHQWDVARAAIGAERFVTAAPHEEVIQDGERFHVHHLTAIASADNCRFHWEPSEPELAAFAERARLRAASG